MCDSGSNIKYTQRCVNYDPPHHDPSCRVLSSQFPCDLQDISTLTTWELRHSMAVAVGFSLWPSLWIQVRWPIHKHVKCWVQLILGFVKLLSEHVKGFMTWSQGSTMINMSFSTVWVFQTCSSLEDVSRCVYIQTSMEPFICMYMGFSINGGIPKMDGL